MARTTIKIGHAAVQKPTKALKFGDVDAAVAYANLLGLPRGAVHKIAGGFTVRTNFVPHPEKVPPEGSPAPEKRARAKK